MGARQSQHGGGAERAAPELGSCRPAQERRRRHHPWFPMGYRFRAMFEAGAGRDGVRREGAEYEGQVVAHSWLNPVVSALALAGPTRPGLSRPGLSLP